FQQLPSDETSGKKIGNAQTNALSRRRDGQQIHQPDILSSFTGRTLEDLSVSISHWLEFWKKAIPIQDPRIGLKPVIHEDRLHLGDGGAFQPEWEITPMAGRIAVTEPNVGKASPADETNLAIDDYEL